MKHIILILGAVIIIGGGIYFYTTPSPCSGDTCATAPVAAIDPRSPDAVLHRVASGEVTLIDVREQSEWDAGHIAGATLIPLATLGQDTLKDISKEDEVYVYCRSGRRSTEAETKLRALGYTNITNIGGIIEWQEKGGALVR